MWQGVSEICSEISEIYSKISEKNQKFTVNSQEGVKGFSGRFANKLVKVLPFF
jgi:hypothetical protein